jgi:hypothetical protein
MRNSKELSITLLGQQVIQESNGTDFGERFESDDRG